jgi:hypothetical protein
MLCALTNSHVTGSGILHRGSKDLGLSTNMYRERMLIVSPLHVKEI